MFSKYWQVEWLLYVKRNVYIRKLWDEFFLQKETFPKEFVEKNYFLNIFTLKIVSFMR